MPLVEDFSHLFRGPGDDGSLAAYTDGAVHDLGMLQQQTDQGIGCLEVLDVQAQLAERSRVQQVCQFTSQQLQDASQRLWARRIVDVLDNVELDVAGAQDLQRAVGLASIGVVVDGDLRHGYCSLGGTFGCCLG